MGHRTTRLRTPIDLRCITWHEANAKMWGCGGAGVTTGEIRGKTARIAVQGEGKGSHVGDCPVHAYKTS